MELIRADTDTCAVVRVSGTVRPLDAPHLREALAKAMVQVPACLVCDLSAVTRLDPVCVAVLVAAQWSGPWPAPMVWLVGAHGQPAEALCATGAGRFLALADSVPTAHARQATEPPRRRERLVLPPVLSAPHRARQFTTAALARWSLTDLTEVAILIVSELVTNGVQHTGTDLEVRLEHGRGLLHIAVRDHGGATSRPRSAGSSTDRRGTPEPLWEHGRGLGIVRAFADGCGRISPPAGGSIYWATLRSSGRATSRSGVGRADTGGPVTESVVVNARRDLRHPGHGWTVRLQMTWRPDDPEHVTLTLSSAPPHPALPAGRWQIGRESLHRGLTAAVRDHNVDLHPTPDHRAVLLELHNGRLVRNARVPAQRIRRFLDSLPAT